MPFRFPVALNPFKSRVPTTRLGNIGKALNPLNPVNAATILLEEAISAVAGRTLGPEAQTRAEYFSFGVLPGIALNVLDAGAVSANQDQLAKQAQAEYLAQEKKRRTEQTAAVELRAPQQVRNFSPSAPTRRPVEETHAPLSRVMPASPTPGADVESLAAKQERTAELMRQMIELGVTGGMTADNMRQWVSSNPQLADRLIQDRLGRKDRLAKEFAGFSGYAQ